MTGWFNYYLLHKTEDYAYLYGAQSESDVSGGLIVKQESTAPRNVSAQALLNAIQLGWTRYDHPIIGGYNVYRRQTGQSLFSHALRSGSGQAPATSIRRSRRGKCIRTRCAVMMRQAISIKHHSK